MFHYLLIFAVKNKLLVLVLVLGGGTGFSMRHVHNASLWRTIFSQDKKIAIHYKTSDAMDKSSIITLSKPLAYLESIILNLRQPTGLIDEYHKYISRQ